MPRLNLRWGREPTEMSRPATTSRAGFMESQVSAISSASINLLLNLCRELVSTLS